MVTVSESLCDAVEYDLSRADAPPPMCAHPPPPFPSPFSIVPTPMESEAIEVQAIRQSPREESPRKGPWVGPTPNVSEVQATAVDGHRSPQPSLLQDLQYDMGDMSTSHVPWPVSEIL